MKQRGFSKYIRVWFVIIKASFKRSYVYKTEIFVRFIRAVFILITQLILLNAIFGESEVYVGWNKIDTYLVIGIWNLLNYLGWSLFGLNLINLESKVLRGDFDFMLLKPISTSWFASFCDFFIYNFVTVLSGLSLIIYYIGVRWSALSYTNIFFGFAGIVIAMILWYGIYLLFASFTISHPKNGFLAVAKEILGLTKYPIDIFGNIFQVIFYTLFPIAFLTTVPARLFMGQLGYKYLVIGLVLSMFILTLANVLWRKNIKGYTSAGG